MAKRDKNSDDFKCRVCGSRNGIRLLFQSDKRQTVHMLTTLANISVKHDDPLPKCICNGCIVKLTDGYNFKMLCEKSDREHRRRLGLPEPRIYRQGKKYMDSDEPGAVLASLYECRRCNLCFSTSLSLQKHFATHAPYPCQFCGQKFGVFSVLKKHEKTHMVCEKCGITTADKESYLNHKRSHELLLKLASVPEIMNIAIPPKPISLAQSHMTRLPLIHPPLAQPSVTQLPLAQSANKQLPLVQPTLAQPSKVQFPLPQTSLAQPTVALVPAAQSHNTQLPLAQAPLAQHTVALVPAAQPHKTQLPLAQASLQTSLAQPPKTQLSFVQTSLAQPTVAPVPLAQTTSLAQSSLAPPPLIPVGIPVSIQGTTFSRVPAVVHVALSAKVPVRVIPSVSNTKPTIELANPTTPSQNARKRNVLGNLISNIRFVPPVVTSTPSQENPPNSQTPLSQTRPVFLMSNKTIVKTSPVNVTAKNPMLVKRVHKYKCNFCHLFFDKLSELNIHQVEHIHKNNLALYETPKKATENSSQLLESAPDSKDSSDNCAPPDSPKNEHEDLIDEFKEEILYDESEFEPQDSSANTSEFNGEAEVKEEVLCSHSPSTEIVEITHDSSESQDMIYSNNDLDASQDTDNSMSVKQTKSESLENLKELPAKSFTDLTCDEEFQNELFSLCETLPEI